MLHSCRRRYRRRLQAPRRRRRRPDSSLLALVRSKGTTAGTYCMRPSLVVHRRVGRYHHGQRIKPLCLCFAAAASPRLASPCLAAPRRPSSRLAVPRPPHCRGAARKSTEDNNELVCMTTFTIEIKYRPSAPCIGLK